MAYQISVTTLRVDKMSKKKKFSRAVNGIFKFPCIIHGMLKVS